MEIRAVVQETNDPDNAMKMSLAYREIKKMIEAGQLTDQQSVAQFLQATTEFVLGRDAESWKGVIDQVGRHWADMQQKNVEVGDYAVYLGEAADGMVAAFPEQRLDPFWIEFIMKLIQWLFEHFKSSTGPFGG
jgi:hypothetical protein